MWREPLIVWVPRPILQSCTADATRYFPRETGGTFMGYWANAHEAVVTRLVDAGPLAVRGRASFEADQKWQLAEIARHYTASGQRHGYLGDWHSHPGATEGDLSLKDRAVLARIIRTPGARAPKPISMVLHGSGSTWNASMWVAQARGTALLRIRMKCEHAQITLYE